MAYENLLVEKKDGIGYVTINRPKVLNALSIKTVKELTDAFEKMGKDRQVAVVILTGSGDKSFVAGADIPEFMKLRPDGARDYAIRGQKLLNLIERLGKEGGGNAAVWHLDESGVSHIGRRCLADQRDGAVFQRMSHVAMPVIGVSGDRDEEISRSNLSGIDREAGNLCVRVSLYRFLFQRLCKL